MDGIQRRAHGKKKIIHKVLKRAETYEYLILGFCSFYSIMVKFSFQKVE
jgi:hypothetical protein